MFAKHFVVDARDERARARELPGALEPPFGELALERDRRAAEVASSTARRRSTLNIIDITIATGRSTAAAMPMPVTRKTYTASLLSSSVLRNRTAAAMPPKLNASATLYFTSTTMPATTDRQHDQQLHDRLLISALRAREGIHPRDRQRDSARRAWRASPSAASVPCRAGHDAFLPARTVSVAAPNSASSDVGDHPRARQIPPRQMPTPRGRRSRGRIG